MGIKYAHAYTYAINQISLDDVYNISLSNIPLDNDNKKIRNHPCIDIDCSLIVRCRGNTNIASNTQYLINICTIFQQKGFEVMLVFDGNERHHSKRATMKRQSEKHHKRIELILHKSELMSIVERRRSVDSIEQRKNLLEEESAIKKKIRTLEQFLKHCTIDVGEKLFNSFKASLRKLTTIKNIKCCQAVFQADTVMAGRVVSGATDIILTSDSDQAALLGNKCISIKKFKYKPGRNPKIESLDVFTATEETFQKIMKVIDVPCESTKKLILRNQNFQYSTTLTVFDVED
jgi:5'-3' exonuclease